ncbi:MAG: hypothetical protein COB81_00620 [Flavobacteriaceae bacterium]|nr:MAG: hypothetical protein COB81_00620 [Flavobacteriaceae bacterium]
MKNEFLLHIVASIAYRFEKVMKHSDSGFGNFKIGTECRTPCAILNHMHHVIKATRVFIQTEEVLVNPDSMVKLDGEIIRFKMELTLVKELLSKQEIPVEYSKKLLQGPFVDLLTHIGQLAMLQGLYGNAIPAEDFSKPVI